RTLIEAARTMLADAKLPVTFWAEAVNTACYVQNRVLVNKSQNKTPYELFNGRTSAIGFIKPFGCHVIILNTLDNLGKFKAKGDEGYFIGYSMSSKAFKVFNKRTRRVEENLHVEFLENKGIEQEVKKDESSLRYIVLPNWAHDAILESTSSNPYEESSTQVPEGSGNPNPTASLSNPPADQMETLTVESPISNVSSPVLNACLNDSPEPSIEARLISKRVANQEETPSLDNILSLTNRFGDILGVSTSSDETIRVEVDVSNMETSISASPTPTLRIYKDHPKSQIIGPVDTPIQTRHKFKMVEEQSFIATIHQKTDPALLQYCLFSCFLSQVEPKKVSDAFQNPSWVEAMQEELL
nr:ribonuclease H-like domain-containing protein [Tanacetum cinerariifolium]